MLDELYNSKILGYAGNISHVGTLDAADEGEIGRATAVSKLCGSRVSVEIRLEGGRISQFAQKVKACALGQASAGIVSEKIIGASVDEIAEARSALYQMLTQNGPPPGGRFGELKYLEPVRDHKSRHASTLLVLDALMEAIATLKGSAVTQTSAPANA